MPQPGRRVAHYEILAPLGAGGMGEVYRARDHHLGREVALKLLPPALAGDRGRLQRFEQEARAAGAVNHPNILAIYDVGTSDGGPYVVSELLEGETLRATLSRAPLPARKAVEYAVQIAHGLGAAHDKGIVHRDLKPDNVFITRDGRGKILDFGLAKLTHPEQPTGSEVPTVTRETEPGTVLGTIAYMSPEQTRGESVDHRSDIFSFGTVLYEMLSGQKAFERGAAGETMAAILRDEPPAVSEAGRRVSPALELVLRRCLEKRPGERFQSAHDLALALEAVSAAPMGAREPGGRLLRARGPAWALGTAIVIVGGLLAWGLRRGSREEPQERTIPLIAVLPLQDLSREPAQDYFADGMTEALITDLAKIGGLRVISRTSVMRFKGSTKPVPEIAKELKVSALLQGSVQQVGDRVRISAQLIDARTDEHLWAESYDRELRDVLALQSEVARETAGAIRVRLTSREEAQLTALRPVDPEAHRLYLQGRHLLNQRTVEAMTKALGYLQRAVAKDPEHALAWAALSEAYSVLDDYGGLPPTDAYPRAIAAARKALEIDPELAEAHASLGHIYLHQRQWTASEKELTQAIESKPSLAFARLWYANFFEWRGRPDEALRQLEQALELDPFSVPIGNALGTRMLYARRYNDAITRLRKTLEVAPDSVQPRYTLVWALSLAGRHAEAIAIADETSRLSPDLDLKIHLAYAQARAGRVAEARALLSEIEASPGAERLPANLAHAYMALGDKERALEWLEKGLKSEPGDLYDIDTSPDMDPLQSDPRFQKIVKAAKTG